jgi:16S rRNA (guanine527-N7)-methyltransferase
MIARAKLQAGLEEIGLPLNAERQDMLLSYLALLEKWNRVYNLTRVPSTLALQRHVLDSLVVLPWLAGRHWLDVGSGAGLPGIVLAIAKPECALTSVEKVGKKAAFQRQVVAELGLLNVRVEATRVEAMRGQYDGILSRAFASLTDFVNLTTHLLAPGGRWYALKGSQPDETLAEGIRFCEARALQVPGLTAQRHLIILERAV